ncbi:MAG: DNA modification methylase [Bacillales bacterium]|nr:DNA modification methylase [Bacillales bacterium]
MTLPVHRWFRYSAGFSAEWVKSVVNQYKNDNEQFNVFDPFVGSGTTLISCDSLGINSIGVESHPLVSRIAKAKLNWDCEWNLFKSYAYHILEEAKKYGGKTEGYPELIYRVYTEKSLKELDSLKCVLNKNKDDSAEYKLTWLALISILRVCSTAGTAQWQYILPNKHKSKSVSPYDAFQSRIDLMVNDMMIMQEETFSKSKGILMRDDARYCSSVPSNWADLIITSPPYANNYDYADATRLEMTFLGEIKKWGDLQEKVRKYLIRSCTQHVTSLKNQTFEILEDELLNPIYEEIYNVCKNLEMERENHGGKKNYHTMIANYFLDLAHVFVALRRIAKEGSIVCFVIGDSAPYGVYVPVDKWLGQLALSAGFKEFSFEKTRDRNIKWKNRKHRVPLKEGRLWIKG